MNELRDMVVGLSLGVTITLAAIAGVALFSGCASSPKLPIGTKVTIQSCSTKCNPPIVYSENAPPLAGSVCVTTCR